MAANTVVINKDPEYLTRKGEKECCGCRGCCHIRLGVALGAGLSGVWAIIIMATTAAAFGPMLFGSAVVNYVFYAGIILTSTVALLTTVCRKMVKWQIALPWVFVLWAYVFVLIVDGAVAIESRVKGEAETSKDSMKIMLRYLVHFVMAGVELWNALYTTYYVWHMRKHEKINRPKASPPVRPQVIDLNELRKSSGNVSPTDH